jgi:hypothetical protein
MKMLIKNCQSLLVDIFVINALRSSKALLVRVANHPRLKSSHFESNPSENSFSVSFSLSAPSTAATQSQTSPTTQKRETCEGQGETLSTDSHQRVREDDVLCILDSIPWSLEGSDAINLVNNCGQNLAHFCAQLRFHCFLVALIERGINIHTKDVNGRTPLNFARLHRDEDAMDILQGDWEDSLLDTDPMELRPTDLLLSVKPKGVFTIQNKRAPAASPGPRPNPSRDITRPRDPPVRPSLGTGKLRTLLEIPRALFGSRGPEPIAHTELARTPNIPSDRPPRNSKPIMPPGPVLRAKLTRPAMSPDDEEDIRAPGASPGPRSNPSREKTRPRDPPVRPASNRDTDEEKPVTPPAAASPVDVLWFYRDPKGVVQGASMTVLFGRFILTGPPSRSMESFIDAIVVQGRLPPR